MSSPPMTNTFEPHIAALHARVTTPMLLDAFSTRVASIPMSPRLSQIAAARWLTWLKELGS